MRSKREVFMKNKKFLEIINSRNSPNFKKEIKDPLTEALEQSIRQAKEKLPEGKISRKELKEILAQCHHLLYFSRNEWVEEDKKNFRALLENTIERVTFKPQVK